MKLTKSTHSATYKHCLELIMDGKNYKIEDVLNKFFGNQIASSLMDALFYADVNNEVFAYFLEENLIYRKLNVGEDSEFFFALDKEESDVLREAISDYLGYYGCDKEIHPEIDPIDIVFEPLKQAPIEQNELFPDPNNKYIQNYDQLSEYCDDIVGTYVLYIKDNIGAAKAMSYLAIKIRDICNDLGIFKFKKEYVDFISFLIFSNIDDVRHVISINIEYLNKLDKCAVDYLYSGIKSDIFNSEILTPLIRYNLCYEDTTDGSHYLSAIFKKYFLELIKGDKTYYEN